MVGVVVNPQTAGTANDQLIWLVFVVAAFVAGLAVGLWFGFRAANDEDNGGGDWGGGGGRGPDDPPDPPSPGGGGIEPDRSWVTEVEDFLKEQWERGRKLVR